MNTSLQHAPTDLMLSDRLLALAQEADRAGRSITAEHLLALAHTVFDDHMSGELGGYGAASAGCSARQRRASLSSSVRAGFANAPLSRKASVGASASFG